MHSGTLERPGSGSPRKRTLSRGVSEDESLRNIIKETENSTRRLTRSDSRGTLKRRSESQQSETDLIMGLPEMAAAELQGSLEETLAELRGLELGREVLLFQVDVLQEALEGTEEMLAEAQREASQASMELDREKAAKRKLESMVASLLQEVERLKEERSSIPTVPVYAPVFREEEQGDGLPRHVEHVEKGALEHVENSSSQDAPLSPNRLESIALDTPRKASSPGEGSALLTFFKKGKEDCPDLCTPPLSNAQLGSSVDLEDGVDGDEDGDGPLTKFQKMVNKTFSQMPTLALSGSPTKNGAVWNTGGSETLDTEREEGADQGKDTDSISAYEDAVADTPEMENVFPGPSDDADTTLEEEGGNLTNMSHTSAGQPQSPNESCIVS